MVSTYSLYIHQLLDIRTIDNYQPWSIELQTRKNVCHMKGKFFNIFLTVSNIFKSLKRKKTLLRSLSIKTSFSTAWLSTSFRPQQPANQIDRFSESCSSMQDNATCLGIYCFMQFDHCFPLVNDKTRNQLKLW